MEISFSFKRFYPEKQKKIRFDCAFCFVFVDIRSLGFIDGGGQYNQSCSIGFPDAWPQCNGSFLPSLDGPGVLIQMIHRVGALVIGLV